MTSKSILPSLRAAVRLERVPERWRPLVGLLLRATALIVLQALLLRVLASTQTVSSLLAPSGATPWGALLIAVLFLVLRITALAVMPALLVATAGSTLLGWCLESRRRGGH